ncbi:MAG: SGNH/GDSL hydrolase family protein [Proteobacteria bacterium]|nr:SGNH/GDSL hydrolase family protein [Pseudomonadota bacterium]
MVVITGLVYFALSWGLHFYWYYQWEKYYVRGPLSSATIWSLAWRAANLSKLSNFAPLTQYQKYRYHHWIERWNELRGPSTLSVGEEMGWPLRDAYVHVLPAAYLAAFRALNIPGKVYRPDLARIEGPDHAFRLLPGARAKFFEAILSINSNGYRGPALERPRNKVRIMCVGGSTTWGATTARNDKPWPEELQDLVNRQKFEVINAGVPGHTIVFNEYLLAEHLALEPDLIILFHGFNDFYFIVRDYASPRRSVTAVEHYYRRYLTRARRAGVPVVLVSFPLAFDRNSPESLKNLYGPWLGKWFKMSAAERLAQMCRWDQEKCLARTRTGKCLVCNRTFEQDSGWLWRLALSVRTPITLAEFEGVIRTHNLITRRLAAQYGAIYVDAARVMFGQHPWFIDFCHYTQQGRRILAKLIYRRLNPLLNSLSARRQAAPSPARP